MASTTWEPDVSSAGSPSVAVDVFGRAPFDAVVLTVQVDQDDAHRAADLPPVVVESAAPTAGWRSDDRELVVAAGQPSMLTNDPLGNAAGHAEIIRGAAADVVVFPELSLTGYHLDAEPVDLDGEAIAELRRACSDARCLALVGTPITRRGADYIAMILVRADRAEVVYLKGFPGGDECDRFASGPGAGVLAIGDWRIGLGICRDTGIVSHVERTAAVNVDLYACGVVHHDHELVEQERRGRWIASTCGAPVVMASCAGPTGGGYRRTAGHSSVWSGDGTHLADAGTAVGGYARAVVTRG